MLEGIGGKVGSGGLEGGKLVVPREKGWINEGSKKTTLVGNG